MASMQGVNHSGVSEFILIGFSTFPHLQLMFFLLFLFMYLFTLLGNLLIMATIWSEHSLHTPMYLFLCALSISEIFYTFAIIPRMLADLLSMLHSIAFLACASQMFFSFTFGFTHSFLLTVMGYDRYVAICHPLRYNVLMSPGITYTVLTPFLSPIIFSLRNKELKNAMKKAFLSKLYPEKI
ncbi:olfactory receptor 10H1-like [Alexandromys fortis]|uniref:olfactory receptor 10H1-like n=1 Tax=Alexandromys fortis TaxID=100897 RepID=UPI002152BC3C|nr:olfactory receptor 10H1-like [Microtus fortis]